MLRLPMVRRYQIIMRVKAVRALLQSEPKRNEAANWTTDVGRSP